MLLETCHLIPIGISRWLTVYDETIALCERTRLLPIDLIDLISRRRAH